jgi:VCBS repeat-containing protein
MVLLTKQKEIPRWGIVLILILSILCRFTSPKSAHAHRIEAVHQMDSHTYPLQLGDNTPYLATRLAAPLAAPAPDSASTNEDTPIDINVLANDTGGSFTITSLITTTTLGAVSINPDQTVHYNPTIGLNRLSAGQVFTDTFQYTIISATLPINTPVSIRVTGVNDSPVAQTDSLTTGENTAADVTVLANDTDPDTGDVLSVTALNTSGLLGSATINANNTIHYDPGTAFNYLQQGQNGTTSFQYTISDGHSGTSSATVNITVNGANDNPVAVADSATTSEDAFIDISVLANDSDPDTGTTLTVTGLNTTGLLGTATIGANNTVHYDPGTAFNYLAVGQNGATSFQYTISDGHGGSASATVNLTVTGVNDPPTAVNDTFTTNENTSPTLNLVSNDTDPDSSDVLTIQSINTFGTLGAVTISSGTSVSYNPITAFNNLKNGQTAIDTFQYTVSDGHNDTSTATVTVMVNGVNDNPTPVNDTTTTGENTATDILVLSNDSDPESDPLTISGLITTGTRGIVTITANNTVHYNPGTAFDNLAVGVTAIDTFQYTANDGQGGSANATVTVTINGANDNPTPVNDAVNTGENTATNFSVLANDTDPDTGDTLTISGLSTASTLGAVTINAGNTSVHYDPGMAFNHLGRSQTASDSFGYSVSDGHGGSASATVTVTITGANDPPTANNDTYTTPANKKLTVAAPGVLANDSDPDASDTLAAALVINPSHGVVSLGPSGGFVYTPTLNYHGLDHFNYHASDGIAASPDVTVTIGVDVTNQPPVVVTDTSSTPEDTPVGIHVLANDYDPDGNLNWSTLKVTTPPDHGTTQVNPATGVINYLPALNYNGIDTFQYEIYDQDAVLPRSGTAPVMVTITPVNDPPQAADLSVSTQEDTPLPINLSGSVSDVDNNLNVSSLQVITPADHGIVAITGNLIITYSPAPNYNGLDQFGYQICDKGSLCATAEISLTVTSVNDPPVAVNDHYFANDNTLVVYAPGVLANDTDVDISDLMTATILLLPHEPLSLISDGSFTYIPKPDPNSDIITDTFKYRAYDGEAYSKTATVTITIDTGIPHVEWLEPVQQGGQIYIPQPNETIPLSITATDNIGISHVDIFRWDAIRGVRVMIANLSHGPFHVDLDSRQLNFGWNQIFIQAFDEAGNFNDLDPSKGGSFWIYRYGSLLPLITKTILP